MPLPFDRWTRKYAFVVAALLLGSSTGMEAQAAARPLPAWRADPLTSSKDAAPFVPWRDGSVTRSHTGTGLLIGGIVGAVATTVFLVGFCDDPDAACGIDEVGRAGLIIGVPITALGALIGSVVHSEK